MIGALPLVFFAGWFVNAAIVDFARGARRLGWIELAKAAFYLAVSAYIVLRHVGTRP